MKTDALIDMLARGAGPVPRGVAARRLLPAVGFGLLASVLLAVATSLPDASCTSASQNASFAVE